MALAGSASTIAVCRIAWAEIMAVLGMLTLAPP